MIRNDLLDFLGTPAARVASKSVKLQRPARATVCSHSARDMAASGFPMRNWQIIARPVGNSPSGKCISELFGSARVGCEHANTKRRDPNGVCAARGPLTADIS
jgi:hypothetical protein